MIRKVSLVKVSTVMEETPTAKLDSPELARDFWRANVATMPIFDAQKEHLVVLMLNTKYRLTAFNIVSIGSLNESVAHPRDVFRPAIVAGAYAIIVMHNHPSGEPAPSQTDHSLTRRLADAGELLSIKVLDHVIIGESLDGQNDYFSFKKAGYVL